MIPAPHMLMIGATGRQVGKTTLACAVVEGFARRGPLVAIKVTTVHDDGDAHPQGGEASGLSESLAGPFLITEESDPDPAKDTGRLLAAGAARVLWMRVRQAHLAEGARALMERIGPGPAVCESNSLRQVVRPGLFLLACGDDPARMKGSAAWARPRADRLVRLVDGRPDLDLDEVRLDGTGWSMPVEATAVIMAGGSSRRMGRDKGLMPIGGQPLIARVADQLRAWCAEVVVSANDPDKYAFLGLRIIADRVPDQGPLMGIASALAASKHERNLVVACDMPMIDRALGREMLARARRADVVLPVEGPDLFEPLFAVYQKSLAEPMFALLAAGRRRIQAIFDSVRVDPVALPPGVRITNLNTPEELRRHLEGT